jgi:hypothetical protein
MGVTFTVKGVLGNRSEMQRPLPPDLMLDDMKKEARTLLHDLLRRDTAALRRYYSTDPLAGLSRPRLDDAQYVIAREHGYSSWRKLEVHAGQTSGNFHVS